MSWSKHITVFLNEASDKEHIKVERILDSLKDFIKGLVSEHVWEAVIRAQKLCCKNGPVKIPLGKESTVCPMNACNADAGCFYLIC